jgi:hypothetical protein
MYSVFCLLSDILLYREEEGEERQGCREELVEGIEE